MDDGSVGGCELGGKERYKSGWGAGEGKLKKRGRGPHPTDQIATLNPSSLIKSKAQTLTARKRAFP